MIAKYVPVLKAEDGSEIVRFFRQDTEAAALALLDAEVDFNFDHAEIVTVYEKGTAPAAPAYVAPAPQA